MRFIITLISLVMERFFHWGQLRNWRWLPKYQRWLGMTRLSNMSSWILLALCILPFIFIVWIINCALSGSFIIMTALKMVFGLLVLMYCLGPKNLWVQVYGCISELNKEDQKAAVEKICQIFDVKSVETSQAFHQSFTKAIFLAAYQRVFGVVFWFVILGPVGAVFYRILALLSADSPLGLSQVAAKTLSILDWIPVRLFTFIFALAGHFTKVFSYWKRNARKGLNLNDTLITESGMAAIDVMKSGQIPEDGEAEKEAVHLLDRAFIIGLVILAMIVLLV